MSYSPEIVPSGTRKSKRQIQRHCRRKLEFLNDEENDESSIFGDFSPDGSEYAPSGSDISDSSVETTRQPQKTAMRKQKDCMPSRDLCNESNVNAVIPADNNKLLNSMFSTPTSSKLGSCVPSPLFSNSISSLVNLSVNVDDIFGDLVNDKTTTSFENQNREHTEFEYGGQNTGDVVPYPPMHENLKVQLQPLEDISHDGSLKKIQNLSHLALQKLNSMDIPDSFVKVPEPNITRGKKSNNIEVNLPHQNVRTLNDRDENIIEDRNNMLENNEVNLEEDSNIVNTIEKYLPYRNVRTLNDRDENITDNVDNMLESNEVNLEGDSFIQDQNVENRERVNETGDNNGNVIKRGRKRIRDEANWKDRLNKRLKNSGNSYVGVRNNKVKNEKVIGDACACKRECFLKIGADHRKALFKHFWKIGDHEKQWQFILRFVSPQSIKRLTIERKNNRSQTILYKLPTNLNLNATESVVVCKKMFLNTFSISEKWVYKAIEKQETTIIDMRGKHLNRPRRMSEGTEESIVTHIKLFPVIESHYTRQRSSKLYLEESLNISKMYRMYKTWFATSEYTQETLASKSQYESIFNSKFNYGFFKPKKDLCDTCFIYRNADEERKEQLKEKYDGHISEKQAVRDLKTKEKECSDSHTKTVACFDLEKVLYLPQSEVSRFYYKRKFSVFNFTVFNVLTKQGYCYVWHQQIAKRGAIEIGSCLWNFIHQEAEKGIKEISLYSDSCAGQNKNRFLFAMFQLASKTLSIDITHRFFETGHSQSEGDTMHACVERAKKNKILYTPEQIYFIIANSKVEGHKFVVKEMSQTDFYNFKELVENKDVNWLTDNNGQKVLWSKIKEVCVRHTEPDRILFKYSLMESSQENSITTTRLNSRRRRKANNDRVIDGPLNLAYKESIPIPSLLHKDLMDLCNSQCIPTHYHGFYKGLIPQNQSESASRAVLDDDDDDL